MATSTNQTTFIIFNSASGLVFGGWLAASASQALAAYAKDAGIDAAAAAGDDDIKIIDTCQPLGNMDLFDAEDFLSMSDF